MPISVFEGLFGGKGARRQMRYERRVEDINRLGPEFAALTDGEMKDRSRELRQMAQGGADLDGLLVPAFALCREAAQRTLGMRPFDVQLMGAMALHEGLVVEMKTGEGKTLVATLPAYLNSLAGQGVHIVTVNDYLAQRDAEWMGPLYDFLGATVGVILEDMGQGDETQARQRAYGCAITYGTNHEIAFDYLRDNLALSPDEVVHRGFDYAIVDEVDFLLIDEARTPLIISGKAREDVGLFRKAAKVIARLSEGYHYVVDIKHRTASLTDAGVEAVQAAMKVDSLYDPENLEIFHVVHQGLLAHGVYRRDVDYIVEGGRVFIVDEFTGRVSEDKRYSDGLHQAIEAKEGVKIRSEDRTVAKVTYQTFYGRYGKLAGMTGTAWSERQEFRQTYAREVQIIPTNRPLIRQDYEDIIYNTMDDKHQAVVEEVLEMRGLGRPVLVGTTSVRESEELSRRLRARDVPHRVLNAKNHRAEAAIIAQAGRKGAVVLSTNMAGRGTDIVLGGNGEMMLKDGQGRDIEALRELCAREREEVVAAGGLHVIGTSHHEAVRIDNQLRGRAGRQGDPGSTQFIVSLDDDLWRRYGRMEIEDIKAALPLKGWRAGQAIDWPRVGRTLRALQSKVEQENQAIRTQVVKYDLVVHFQRETIYKWRRTLVTGEGFDPEGLIRQFVEDLAEGNPEAEDLAAALQAHFLIPFELPDHPMADRIEPAVEQALALLAQREEGAGREAFRELGRVILLQSVDELWTEHLSQLERVEEGIGLHGYAGVDPVLIWRKEATEMWVELHRLIRSRVVFLWFSAGGRPRSMP